MSPVRGLPRGLLAACALALLQPLPALAAGADEIIDGTGDGIASLIGSEGVAVDGAGNAYVIGTTSDNVFKITPGGVITEIIDTSGDGGGNILDGPFDLDADSVGNVYVAGSVSDNAFMITPGGVITEIIDATGDGSATLVTPFGIAVDDATGNVYVTGRGSWNCFEITPGGVVTEIINYLGDGVSALQEADGVAVDGSSNVYVTGRMSDNAFKITPGGVITEIIDSTGDGSNSLDCGSFNTCGVAAAADGTVYITAGATDNAFKVTAGGVVTQILDATGDGLGGGVNLPQGVAVDDSTGNVYVACAISDNAFEITPAGVITEIIDASGDGMGNTLDAPDVACIATDGAGTVFVSAFFTDNAFEIDPDGTPAPVSTVTEIIYGSGDGISPLVNPDGVDVDLDGNVYVSGCGNNPSNSSAFKITPGGVITEILDGTGDGSAIFDCAVGLELDSHGNAYVAGHRSDNVFKVAPDGTVTLVMDWSDGILAPFDVAVDRDDNVYVTGFGSDNAFKITPGGVITEIIDASGDGVHALDMPFGIAVDDDGNVYVAGNEEDIAFKITPGGVITTIIDATGDGTNSLSKVADVEVDGLGNTYVTGNGSDNVFRIDSVGTITQVLDISNGLDNPTCVVTDTIGNVYVAGFDSNNVTRLTPQGAITQVLTSAGDGVNGFVGPADDCLAVDRLGNVYATGTLSFHNVFKIEVVAPRLTLTRSPAPDCVEPGETVTVELHMSDLDAFEAADFTAYIAYDDLALTFVSAVYTTTPFGLPTIVGGSLNPMPGQVDLAAGIDGPGGQLPTTDDALLATLTFTANEVVDCDGTSVGFRAHDPSTKIADLLAVSSDLIVADASPVVIDGEAPVIAGCPSDIIVPVAVGVSTAVVTWTAPTATDTCDGLVGVVCSPPSGSTFPVGVTPVTCTAIDACGSSSECSFDVTVTPTNEVNLTMDLDGVFLPVTRCIRFATDDCGNSSSVELAFIDHDANGSTPVRFVGSIEVGAGSWTILCAKDEQHTLWSSTNLSVVDTMYVAGSTLSLVPGDSDNDGDVDINDVTLLLGQFGNFAAAGGCPFDDVTRDSDFDNNGAVAAEDYAAMAASWLVLSSCGCAFPAPDQGGPVTALRTRDVPHRVRKAADRNRDGIIDHRDVRLFELEHHLPHTLSAKIEHSIRSAQR